MENQKSTRKVKGWQTALIIIAVIALISAVVIGVCGCSKTTGNNENQSENISSSEKTGSSTDSAKAKAGTVEEIKDNDEFNLIREKVMDSEKTIEIDGKKVVLNKTTIQEMLDNGWTTNDDVNQTFEGGASVDMILNGNTYSFDIYTNGAYKNGTITGCQAESNSVTIAGKTITLGKSTIQNLIDDGWSVQYKVTKYEDESTDFHEVDIDAVMTFGDVSWITSGIVTDTNNPLNTVVDGIY